MVREYKRKCGKCGKVDTVLVDDERVPGIAHPAYFAFAHRGWAMPSGQLDARGPCCNGGVFP